MIPPAIGDGLALVETLAPFGSHRISFDRDTSDSFTLTLQRLAAGEAAGQDVRQDVQKDQLLPLLPRGSRWHPALGWRSFVVLPFEVPGVCAAAVGMEGVVPHSSRGAFPIMRAFLMQADRVSPALLRLAAGLPAVLGVAGLLDRRGVVIPSDALSAVDHQRYEAPMLLAAAEAWRSGEAKLLRTVLLSDDQAPWPRRWTEALREAAMDEGGRSYLVATVPPIRAQFSRSTRLTLWKKAVLG